MLFIAPTAFSLSKELNHSGMRDRLAPLLRNSGMEAGLVLLPSDIGLEDIDINMAHQNRIKCDTALPPSIECP